MGPDRETVQQIVSLYKKWYSEQNDKPFYNYVMERWEDDTAKVASNAFTTMMGDPEQDLEDIINELKIIIKKLKS